jgi:hypothetical protein
MGEEEKNELQPTPEQAAAESAAPSAEKISEEDFATVLKDAFGDFKKLSSLLPSFKTADGDLVRGVEWLDPKKDFQRKEFLTKPEHAKQRQLLSERLRIWAKHLASSNNPDDVRKNVNEEATKLESNLDRNMKRVHKASREMETAYRAVEKFFANAQSEPDEKVDAWFANVGMEELMDPDDREKFEQLSKAVADEFREWGIKRCFSMCVMPGYLGSVTNVDTVARQLGLPNKVHIVTDMPNFESVEELQEMLDDPSMDSLTGVDDFKQYVSLYANYIMAREGNQFEDNDLWIPPSSAVAGKMYQGDESVGMQQPAAGYKYGKINEAEYVRFRANQPDASKVNEKGVNPLVNFEGQPVAMGSSTLYRKETFNVYSIRRTYDYVYKTLRNYLNKQTFNVIDTKFIDTLKRDIDTFMRAITGGDNILQDYSIEVYADEEMRKRQEVDIKVALNPRYPARTFNIEFTAYNEENQTNVKDK